MTALLSGIARQRHIPINLWISMHLCACPERRRCPLIGKLLTLSRCGMWVWEARARSSPMKVVCFIAHERPSL